MNASTRRPKVETETYLAHLARTIRAAGPRVADADEIELAELLALEAVLKATIQTAVDGQRARGVAWSKIALAAGTTPQAAGQRWGKK